MKMTYVYLIILVLSAFVTNWFWEMLQMPGYVEMADKDIVTTFALCTRATVGDVIITLAVYFWGALAAGDLKWGMNGKRYPYLAAGLSAALVAIVIEYKATVAGAWHYNEKMPLVPFTHVGLWPFFQLTLLVPLSMWLSYRISKKLAS